MAQRNNGYQSRQDYEGLKKIVGGRTFHIYNILNPITATKEQREYFLSAIQRLMWRGRARVLRREQIRVKGELKWLNIYQLS